MCYPERDCPKRDARGIADRLILASSLLLRVLAVIFSTFMSAERFWRLTAPQPA